MRQNAAICMIAFSAALGGAASAETTPEIQLLARIVNTRDNNYHLLGVMLDGKANITGLRFETHEVDLDRASHQLTSRDIHVREFSPAAIASPHGAVLDGTPGHDAIILRGSIAPDAATAALVVSFLYNGFTGETRACRVTLTREKERDWHLLNSQDQPVSLIVVKTRALPVIGTVGIETLQGICANG